MQENIHTLPHGESLDIPRRRGILESKILKEMYEPKQYFLAGGWGAEAQTQKLYVGMYRYFLKHNIKPLPIP